MVKSCCVVGCANRAKKGSVVRFFKFPTNKVKKRAWIRAINRKGWEPNTSCRVCSDHFVTGWHSDDREDENFRPTVFPYKRATDGDTERSSRAFRRDLTKTFEEAAERQEKMERRMLDASISMHASYTTCMVDDGNAHTQEPPNHDVLDDVDFGVIQTTEQGIQCEADPLQVENELLREETDN